METREIKFRAWTGTMMEPWNHIKAWESLGHHLGTASEFVFMQFTGLHDKNGVEIYEGDILKSVHFKDLRNGKVEYLRHRVTWDQAHSGWIAVSIGNKSDSLNVAGNVQLWVYFRNAEEPERIGNIYEHPHLLNL